MQQQDDVSFVGLFVPLTTKKIISFLFIVGFCLFFISLFNGFVGDDNTQVLQNPSVHSLITIPANFLQNRLLLGNAKLGSGYYKPILDTTFTLLYVLFGSNGFGYHVFQVLLSCTNAVLVFLFFRKFFKKELAFILSLLFLIHPINSEDVLYISALQEGLFFFFGMSALLIISSYHSQKAVLLASVALLLSLFSKETGALFVGITILYTFLFKRTRFLQILGWSGGVCLIYAMLRFHAIGLMSHATINAPIERLSLWGRVVTMPSIVWFYIRTFLFPLYLSSSWQWIYTTIDFLHVILPLLGDGVVLGIIGWMGWKISRKNQQVRLYLFFTAWFLMGIVFHLQILPLDQTAAERWFYFPVVGVLGMCALMMENYKILYKNTIIISCLVIILSLLAARTFVRSWDYSNDFTLALHDTAVAKDSYNLEYILSHEYYMRGNLQEAEIHAKRSVALFPYITNYTNLGAIYSSMGDYTDAKINYLRAMQYGDDALPYENLAMLSLVSGSAKGNISFIQKALKKYPTDGVLWMALTETSLLDGDMDTANHALNQAKTYSRDPYLPLMEYIVVHNKPLKLDVRNGSVTFYTMQ